MELLDLFYREDEVLGRVEEVLDENKDDDSRLYEEYEYLAEEYMKFLEEMKFIFSVSDKNHRVSKDMQKKLEKEIDKKKQTVSKLDNKIEKLSQKLIRINNLKEEFISTTSQELKLPVNNIISSVESIVREGSSYLNDDLKEKLASIIKNGKKMNYMVNEFVDYAKVKYEDIELNKDKYELSELIDSIISFFEHLSPQKEIEFYNRIEKDKFAVVVDKSRFMQIFYNIINVSDVKESIAEGKFIFSASLWGEKIQIKIESDSSIAKGKNIFKRYNFDLDGEINNIDDSITSYLVKLHNGELEVREKNNRSLLLITFPGQKYFNFSDSLGEDKSLNSETPEKTIENENPNSSFLNSSTSKKIQQESILLVNNRDRDSEILETIMEKDGYFITTVSSGRTALKVLDNSFSLVVLDIFLVDTHGIELCEKIREKYSALELPVLITTSRNNPRYFTMGYQAGANDFIKKPFEVSELRARIRTLINLQESVEEAFSNKYDLWRAQIKPHFLYNTIDTIAIFCDKNPKLARKLILDLGRYLRYSFDFEGMNKFISVKEELEMVRIYVNIQKVRFQDKVNVVINREDELDFGIPPLIIQPLVENAIKHGILENKDGGIVEVNIYKADEYNIISVKDDGQGMDKKVINDIFYGKESEKLGIGLSNVKRRIKQTYSTQLEIESEKGKGSTVTIKIPG